MPRLAAVVLLALLATGSGGCVVLGPTVPLCAAGYGHTYSVTDQDGHPLKEGLLLLRSKYKIFPLARTCTTVTTSRTAGPMFP